MFLEKNKIAQICSWEAEIKVFNTGFRSLPCCHCSNFARADLQPWVTFYMEVPDSLILLTTQDSWTECQMLEIKKHHSR